MKPSSIDEQIEKLEKSIIHAEKELPKDTTSNSESFQETIEPNGNKSNSNTTALITIGILLPVLITGALYYTKPKFVMTKKKKTDGSKKESKQLNTTRLLQIGGGSALIIWSGLYMYNQSKK